MHQHANVGARHVHERHTTSGVALRPPSGVPRQRLSRSAAALQTQSSTASDLPQQQLPNGFIIRHTSTPAEVFFLYDEVYSQRQYLQHGLHLQPGDTVVDVGANIGLCSMLAAEEVGPTGKVFAIEPAPRTAAALASNLQAHAVWWQQLHGKPVASSVVLPVAITDSPAPTTVEFTVYTGAAGWSTLVPDDGEVVANMQRYVHSLLEQLGETDAQSTSNGGSPVPDAGSIAGFSPLQRTLVACARQLDRAPVFRGLVDTLASSYVRLVMLRQSETVTVPAKSVSTIIQEQGIRCVNLLKVDVERAELQVLQGIQPQHWPLIHQVTMEVHDIDGRLAEVVALLQQHGFQHVVCEQMGQLKGSYLHNVYAAKSRRT